MRVCGEDSPEKYFSLGEKMGKSRYFRLMGLSAAALAAGSAAVSEAQAGAFGVREQSTYFMGDAYAGSAAGGDISSMFWNPAATATLPGFNSSSSYTGVIGRATETATGGLFVTGNPSAGAPGLAPSTDVGTSAFVPASYLTLQLTDRLYAGVGLNAPFGFVTKPDNLSWAGSPIATTTKVFSLDANPTIAYKLTPTLTVGAGAQIEYFEIKLDRSAFNSSLVGPLTPSRAYKADDVGVGATAGVLWQPREGTSVGLGYRSAVSVNVSGLYANGGFTALTPGGPVGIPGFSAIANGKLTLPDEITFSARQAVTQQLTVLGTVEWNRWSSLGNVSATGAACPAGTCETLHLNYQDGWFFSVGAEYAYSPSLTLRTGVGYEMSPVKDGVRDILLPDSNRVHLNFGASYKWSDKITINAAYSHLFFDDAPFCIANGGGTSHCTGSNQVLLSGSADVAVDIVSVGVNYKFYGPEPLEPLK
jgi:long-chain fatty acid transport protein